MYTLFSKKKSSIWPPNYENHKKLYINVTGDQNLLLLLSVFLWLIKKTKKRERKSLEFVRTCKKERSDKNKGSYW